MGTVSFAVVERLIGQVAGIPGDLIELGVFRGDTFLKMLPLAQQRGCLCFGVDSFSGMAAPGPRDGTHYPEGKFSVGGPGALQEQIEAAGCSDAARVCAGRIPAVLEQEELQARCGFAFAHVDLDHYQPTLDSLRWLWGRTSPGAVVAVHDYFETERGLASAAVRDFAKGIGVKFEVEASAIGASMGISSHAVFRREV